MESQGCCLGFLTFGACSTPLTLWPYDLWPYGCASVPLSRTACSALSAVPAAVLCTSYLETRIEGVLPWILMFRIYGLQEESDHFNVVYRKVHLQNAYSWKPETKCLEMNCFYVWNYFVFLTVLVVSMTGDRSIDVKSSQYYVHGGGCDTFGEYLLNHGADWKK